MEEPMPIETHHFHLEEYKSLREEAQWMLKDYRGLERNVALACAGLLAWFFGKDWGKYQGSTVHRIAFFIPLALAVVGSIRAWGILSAFSVLHGYLLKLETLFCLDSERAEGWEHFLDAKTNGDESSRRTGASKFAVGFWATLILITLAVAIVVGFNVGNIDSP
jgi:ABC-type sugar transport system permease subunit